MARDERKRQQQLARKKAKRREALTRTEDRGGNLFNPLAQVHACYVSDTLFSEGIGPVVVSRVVAFGQISWAVFMLDVWCLGVKNVYSRTTTPTQFQSEIRKMGNRTTPMVSKPPAYVKKLILEAETWARGLGIEPHPDYQQAKKLLAGIDAAECNEQFVFGKDGKPFYCQGPRDSPIKVKHIMNALRRTCGEGKFDFMLVLGPGAQIDTIDNHADLTLDQD